MKLLIVDDHEGNLKLLSVQLGLDGHEVIQTTNGVEALEALATEHVDGVISDIFMPRMDGYRLCLEIRRREGLHDLPLVLYSSTYCSPADRKLAATAGADAYIDRPAPVRTLVEAVRTAAANPARHALVDSPAEFEAPVLQQYNQTLVRKLEDRNEALATAHEGLVEIEARLSGLIESAMDAIIAVDEQQKVVLFNAAAVRMFDRSRQDALGSSLSDFIPQRFRQAHGVHIEAFSRESTSARRMNTRVVQALRADGTEFPIEASISKLQTARGLIHTVFVRDVTERQCAEQALARSEAGLRRAQEVAQLAHVITSTDGRFESWSETLPTLTGLTTARLPGTTREWLELIHPDDRPRFRDVSIEAARTGRRREIDYRMRRHDGWLHVRHVMDPLPGSQEKGGNGRRWFNTLQDISEQKQAEARILGLNRVYAVLSGINTLIVRAHDKDELLREACRIAVEAGQFAKAWIGILDEGRSIPSLAARYGAPDAFFDDVQSRLDADIDSQSVPARAIAERRIIVSDDLWHVPDALEHSRMPEPDAHTLAAFPLLIGDTPVGVLVLYAESTDFFQDEGMRLLRELAGDISFALDHLTKTERIHYLAHYDSLTGLPNRTLFTESVSQRIEAIGGRSEMFAVALVDLERFRSVNETLGRSTGDELLRAVATRLKQANPSAARLGADLFAFKVVEKYSVADVARALDDMATHCFADAFALSGDEFRIGCRGGIAVFPTDGGDAETLLRNAEAALHRAKLAAQQCVFYTPDMNARAAEAMALESKLRRAIERREFVLHYQPKVSFDDGRIVGVEALIRWQDPEQGLVPPGRFIPVLEESGLINAVGSWALGQAMADHRRWRAAGFDPVRVAVNVSPFQLQQADYATQVRDVVALDGGSALELEITESLIMENVDRNIAMLKGIRKHGVSIAIDDFGTGYCSLAYIAKLPVTALKIDRSFVLGMTEGPEGMALVSSIIALAHALKLKVVAEGVDTQEQARLLRLLACDEAQGYLYSRPVPAADIEALLRTSTRTVE